MLNSNKPAAGQKQWSRGVRLWGVLMKLGHYAGCHQMYERSFTFRGYQFPVCARCTGLFLGQLAAVVFLLLGWRCSPGLCFALIALMAADGLCQLLTNYQSTNLRRLLTGCLAGFGLLCLVVAGGRLLLAWLV